MVGYVFLEHMSDALLEAYGATLEEAFSNAARALTDTMIDIGTVEKRVKVKFDVQGGDLENLLYNWLEAVLVKVTTDGLVFSSFDVKIRRVDGQYVLHGAAQGEELNPEKHKAKMEVKAVTYHLMQIKTEEGQVTARFLLDL